VIEWNHSEIITVYDKVILKAKKKHSDGNTSLIQNGNTDGIRSYQEWPLGTGVGALAGSLGCGQG